MTDRSKKITELPAASSVIPADLLLVVKDTAGTPNTHKVTAANLFANVTANTVLNGRVTLANTTTISGPVNLTNTFSVGGTVTIAANGAWVGNSSGLKGEVGSKGDKGEVGSKGEVGTKGDYGVDGSKGDKGEVGSKGDTGATGSKGDKGEVGAKGDTGTTGAKGDKGEVGSKGDKGEVGTTGSSGSKGDKGEVGTTGSNGTDGTKGDKGDLGDKGDTGTGTKGDKGEVGSVSGGTITGNLIPSADNTYTLGNTTHKWAHLYVAAGTVTIGNVSLSDVNGQLSITSNTGQTASPLNKGAVYNDSFLFWNGDTQTANAGAVHLRVGGTNKQDLICNTTFKSTFGFNPQYDNSMGVLGNSSVRYESSHIVTMNANTVISSNYTFANTTNAPASASATGTVGQIRVDGDYIYVCVATDTWKRASLNTW